MTIPRNLSILAEGASSSGVLGAAYGGTGLSTPGTSGNVLTSNGTGWVSSAPAGGGGLTLLATLTPANATTTATATSLTSSKSFQIITDSITLSANGGIKFAISADNGSTYSTPLTFTSTNGATTSGYVQMFRTDSSSSNKPYIYITASGTTASSTITTSTGTINAIQMSITSAATFTGTGNIYIYGMN
jgi:hypothetical protein